MAYLAFGNTVFKDRGFLGVGVPSYSKRIGYQPAPYPTAVGARYFGPKDHREWDEETDAEKPIAMGNKWDGGRPVYQERVYNAAKKDQKKLGFTNADIDDLKPRKVA